MQIGERGLDRARGGEENLVAVGFSCRGETLGGDCGDDSGVGCDGDRAEGGDSDDGGDSNNGSDDGSDRDDGDGFIHSFILHSPFPLSLFLTACSPFRLSSLSLPASVRSSSPSFHSVRPLPHFFPF